METESEIRQMAECMVGLRLTLISAGIVDQSVPPMFIDDAVIAKVRRLESDYAALARERDEAVAEVERWKADSDTRYRQAMLNGEAARKAKADRDRLREALEASHDEVVRLRSAMFRVYATAANGKDTTDAIEKMRDEMDKPWSGDIAVAAIARATGEVTP